MIAQIVSADVPVVELWPRCAGPIVALVDGRTVSVALCAPTGDHIVFDSADEAAARAHDARPVEPRSLAAATIAVGDTQVRETARGAQLGVAIRFGRRILGAIVVEGVPDEALEHVPLLESCALYVAARIDHESTVERSERYARLALLDALTGVANRRKFDDTLATEWARAARDGTSLAVVMLDLDFFKQFNDSYGHQAGDLCLQQVARALSECIRRPADLLARYGGEEFVALLPATELAGATVLAETMRETLAELNIVHAATSLGRVSLSAGVAAAFPQPGSAPEDLVRAADAALYEAKFAGRNRVVAQGYVSEAPAAHDLGASAPTNLPIAVSRLVGRRAEIADIRGLVEEQRLVTVLGFGGTGKTRVALQVAAELVDRYKDGTWLVDLAALDDPALVATTIGSVVGVEVSADGDAAEALGRALRTKQALLLVDNCEHLVEAAARAVAALLQAAPGVHVLTTSREALDLAGETIYRLPLLSLPPRPADLTADEAIRADAVALFVERARAANRSFELTDANAPAVAELVHRLDGIALAIELAAARLGAIGVEALSARLDERFRLLTSGDRAALPRQQTMRATIDWSWDLLEPDERLVFRRLAIFAGSFTIEGAVLVCTDAGLPGDTVFELVVALVGKSLVGVEMEGGEDRYFLLETMRHYARERLVEGAEYDVLADRHAAYALRLADELDARYQRTSARAWHAAAERNLPTFRAALEWTLGARTDVQTGARIAAAAAVLLLDYAAGEGVRWLRSALALLPAGADAALEGRLWLRLAGATRVVPAAELRAAAERAIELHRARDDRQGLANALRTLAQVLGWYFRGERERADELALESIAIARAAADPLLIADCLKTRGLTIDLQNVSEKRAVLVESLDLFRTFGNDRQVGTMLTWISDFEFSVGDEARALDYGRDALRYARASGNLSLQETAAGNLAFYAATSGDWETARRAGVESLRIAAEAASLASFTWAVQALAMVSAGTGDIRRAARLLGFCDARAGRIHVPRQADQCEDIAHRRLLAALDAELGAELSRELATGALFDEDAAMREALAV